MFETARVVLPENRAAFIPSDVMSLAQYIDFKRKFNERVPGENAKIETKNVKLAANSQPLIPKLELFPMETVLVMSEKKPFIVTMEGFRRVTIPSGVFNCPIELIDHWYVVAHGVKAYVNPVAPLPVIEPEKEASSALKNIVTKKAKA
jgi:hypothetical protein